MDELGGRNTPAKRKRTGPAYEQCLKILRAITKLKTAGDFLTPVDYKSLGLTDYPTIIVKPMDLGTVLSKLIAGQYDNAQQMKADVELIFSNCAKYNGPDHPISLNGFSILDKFNKSYSELKTFNFDVADDVRGGTPKGGKGAVPPHKKVRPAGGPNLANAAPVVDFSFEEKRQLCILINNLDQKYLPQVIHIIHKYAPSLLDTDASQAAGVEEIEISVDSLQPGVLRELDTLIKTIRHPNAGIVSSQPVAAPQPVQQQATTIEHHAQPHTQQQSAQPVQQQHTDPAYYTQNYAAAAAPANHTADHKPADAGSAGGAQMDVVAPQPTEAVAAAPSDGTDAFMSIQ